MQIRKRELIRSLFRVPDNRAPFCTLHDAILPSETAPVVRIADDGESKRVKSLMDFVRTEPGKAPQRVVNTRDDQVRGNPFWRESFRERRCLPPGTSYSEPQGVKPATWE